MDAITLQEAKRDFEGLVERAASGAGPTLIRTDSGREVVFLALDEFQSWRETLYLLSNRANADHLRRSIAQADEGQAEARDLIEP